MKKPKLKPRKKENTGQKFWIHYEDEGHCPVPIEVDTFQSLSHHLLRETMRANDFTFRRKNKIAFVELWTEYFNAMEDEKTQLTPLDCIHAIAITLVDSFKIMHKRIDMPVSNRNRKWVILKIRRQLESVIKPSYDIDTTRK